MKKSISLLLSAAMISSLLVSCSPKEPSPGETSNTPAATSSGQSQESNTASPASGSEKKTIEVMMHTRDAADFQNMEFYKNLEEQTNVKANLTTVMGIDWTTKTNLMFASGDYPDIILRGGIDMEMYGVDQKILIPLDDLVEQYMPVYKEILYKDPEMPDLIRASDGYMYNTGWMVPQNISLNSHLFVNKLWLDNLGMEIPTNHEEFEAMLTAFRDDDPNQNGENDEIPFTGTLKGSVDGTLYMLSLWGIPYNSHSWAMIDDNDKITSQLLHENMREALTVINKWYSEKLLDVECIAQDTTAYEAKVNAGITGSFWRWRMLAMGTSDEVVEQYVGIVPPAAEGAKVQLTRYLEIPGMGASITANCKELEAACRWLDAQYEFENQMNGYYGPYKEVEEMGETVKYGWRYNDDGKVEFHTADLEEIPNQSAMHFYSGEEYFDLVEMPAQRVEKTDLCNMYADQGIIEKNSGAILTNLCKYTIEEIERKDLLKAEIDKYAEEALVNFITKGVTDSGWETYISNLNNIKIDEYIKIHQDAYDRYLAALN